MKIYKPAGSKLSDDSRDLITELLDNQLSIDKKLNNLINSYSQIKLTPDTENQLIERLVLALGGKIRFPRVGDNNERFDAFIEFDEYYSIVEIEIPSTTILDTPRNLLDDYAVAKSRNKINDKPIVPLVICWDLPNKRTDYWNVIYDINKVLNLKIKTISIPALALHYWSNTPLDLQADYYLDIDNQVMDKSIEILKQLGFSTSIGIGYFEPIK